MQVVDYVRTGHEDGPALVLAGEGSPSEARQSPPSDVRQGSPDERRTSGCGELEPVPLEPGADLAFTLGERHCAGAIVDGRHEFCERPAAPYCDRHTERWPCAQCVGDCRKPIDNCEEVHAVYLAAFAPDVHKVGVTKEYRLETRLREQGAERGAHLRTVADGRIARQLEAEIAEEIPDRVRASTKVAGLHRSVDEAAWAARLDEFDPLETVAFDYGLDLEEAPIPETTATGTVVGVQGRLLVLADGGTNYAVDMRDLLGHEVRAGRSDRQRQASLGSFS